MVSAHNPKARFGMTLQEATSESAPDFAITDGPPLPVVNFGAVGKAAPTLLSTPAGKLPKASTVIITWASAEWAALQHVFCAGSAAMPYSERSRGSWTGWEKYSSNLPAGAPSSWNYWGYYRLVQIGGNPVLLFKSNTHLDWPGAAYLKALIDLLVKDVSPTLILSVGTAGGAKPQDHVGTVRAVSAGTLYESGQPQSGWPEYKNVWKGSNTLLTNTSFSKLVFPVPTKTSDLQKLCAQFNQQYHTNYPLAQLDPGGLALGDASPQIDNQTGGAASLLTASTFLVGTTSGTYQAYTCIEMDDAVIGAACAASGTPYGFVRNLSDPAQSAALLPKVQGNWGSAVYDAYGFYTSYNGAVAAWALLA
jgi:nucleoside phosphorylase